ncbi:MAG: Lrp/AsnC family transcriptional regulator [Pseudomonadota bacterium]
MLKDLDRIDRKILHQLQDNANISAAQLGEDIGLSQAACWRRIQRLESEGYILKRVAVLDPEKLGFGTLVLAHVRLSAHGRKHLEEFANAIKKLPQVLECFVLMGDQDFFLKVTVKDVYEYQEFFFEKLSSLKGVAEVKSAMALSRIKNEIAYPVLE